MYSGLFSTGGSAEFTPPLYSGFSRTGGRIRFPFSSTGVFVDNGPVYSCFSLINVSEGFSLFSIGLLYSNLSDTGGSVEFTAPLNSGFSTTGGRIKFPLSLVGELVEIGFVYSGLSLVFFSGTLGKSAPSGLGIKGVLVEINLSVTLEIVISPVSGFTS